DRGFKTFPDRIQVENAPAVLQQRVGRKPWVEDVDQIAVQRLVSHRIVAVRGGKALAGRRPAHVFLTAVVKQVRRRQGCLVAEDGGYFPRELVIIVDLQDGAQVFGLQ